MNSSNFNSHHPPQPHFSYHSHHYAQQHQHNSLRDTPSISSPTLSSLEMITPSTPTTSTRTSDIPAFSSVTDLHNLDDSFSVVRTPLSINAFSSNDDIRNDVDNEDEAGEDEDDDNDDDDNDDDDDDEDDNNYEDPDSEDAIFRISSEQAAYYRSQFSALQPDLHGLVRGTVAKVFFEKSGLPVSDLSAIWKLSDGDRDGALSLPEFSIAMHLVVLKRNGVDLPPTLPSVMLQVYGSMGVPVYHLPSPLAGVPSVTERENALAVAEGGRNRSSFWNQRHFSGDSADSGSGIGDQQQQRQQQQQPQYRIIQRQSSLQESASQSAGGTPYFGVESAESQHYRKNQWTVFTESPPPPQSGGGSRLFSPLKSSTSTPESIITSNLSPATYLYIHQDRYPHLYRQYQEDSEKEELKKRQKNQFPPPQPPLLNFDYDAESIASDPNIRHPVPLRFSPLLLQQSDSPTTVATASAFTRLSMTDKSRCGNSGDGSSGNGSGTGLLSPGSDTSKNLELSHLTLSSIPAIPGEWHVATKAKKSLASRNTLIGESGSGSSDDGTLGKQFYNLMNSPNYIDDEDDDDDEDYVNNCDENNLATAYLGLGDGANNLVADEEASPAFDESSKPYLIPREGTLHSVLAIQGLEERLIARYMNSNDEQTNDSELNHTSSEELRKMVKNLQEQIVVANKQNEMLLVEMLTLLKLVRKGVNKV